MRNLTVFKGSKDGVPKQSTTQKPDQLVGDQVFVKVTASGVCGTGTCLPYFTIKPGFTNNLIDLHFVSDSTWHHHFGNRPR